MANYIYIATSLDGFIAEADGGIDWLTEFPNPDNSDFGFAEFLERVDAIVMGRNTFETVLAHTSWPYPKKVFVLSNSLKEIPEELKERAELMTGSPIKIVTELGERGYRNLYIDGGQVIQAFLQDDLIDEMIITRLPLLLGGGIPLFGKLTSPLKFRSVKTEALTELMVKSYYIK